MTPFISIIVPVYNSEKTLHRCIDSIINQPMKDWELLLIDDGSKDTSGEICDEYAAKDYRIKVFHKENGGVSSARNYGLKFAIGEWIVFVDSDDELSEYTFTEDCKSFTEDLIVGAYYIRRGEGLYHSSLVSGIYSKNKLLEFLEENISAPVFGVVWGKLLKNRLCNGLTFDSKMRVGEDTLFVMQYLQRVSNLRIIEKDVYVYHVPDNFVVKYNLDIENSIYCLNRIYLSYRKLRVRSKAFERRIFFDYKLFCQKRIYQDIKSWYNDERIKYIYSLIKDSFPLKYRIIYALMSNILFSKFINLIRRINS